MKKILLILCLLLCACQNKNVEDPSIILENNYFNITIPSYWKGHYVYETINDEMGYAIVLYEKESYQQMQSGHLMTISLYSDPNDYSFIPSYEVIGSLKNDEITYEVVIEYPTDVQFNDDTKDEYHELCKDLDDIILTFQASSSFTYIKQ